jgi:hypothetical protein
MATVLEAVDFDDECVARVAVNCNLRLRAW